MPRAWTRRQCPHRLCGSHATGAQGRPYQWSRSGLKLHNKRDHSDPCPTDRYGIPCEECKRVAVGRSTGAWAPRSDHARVRENERKRRMRKAAAEAACAEVQAAADAMETVIEGAMITSADSVEEDQSGGDSKENDSVDEVVGSKRGRKHTPWSQLSARSKRRRR